MRGLRLLLLASLAPLLASGVACTCEMPVYQYRRTVSADITWSGATRYASWGPETWVGDGTPDTDTTDFIWYPTADMGYPPAAAKDLRIFPYLGAVSTGADDPNAGFHTKIGFLMFVHDVTTGPAEIDLDDARASLTVGLIGDTTESFVGDGVVHHGLAGHLSLTQFAPGSCPGGPFTCVTTVRGTIAFTATGADGELVSVTGGTISGTDRIFEGTQTCPTQD
jgi:hypothetical protein